MITRINRSLAWLIVICMISSLFPLNAFATYSDVEKHWGQVAIDKWSDMGIIQGSNGEFRPNDSITRGEMAVIIDRIMKYQTKSSKNFTDLNQAFYTDAILKANASGVIQGDGKTVRPNDKITREEAVVMLGRALGLVESTTTNKTFSDTSKISSWAIGYVNIMSDLGYINGSNGNFHPKNNITRAEAITILDNSIKKLYNEAKEFSEDVSGISIINTKDVVLKDMKIKGNLIISEGVGSGDVTLDGVTVTGNVIVRGGGVNSIHIKGNSNIDNIIIEKTDDGSVRVVTYDGCVVDAVYINDGMDDIILTGSFNKVTIAADVSVKVIDAEINNIEITSADLTLYVDKDSKITEIIADKNENANISISNQGIITKATIADGVTLSGNKPVTLIAPMTTPINTSSGSNSSSNNSITAKDFNSYTTTLAIDYSQATQLPLTGYFTKVVGTDRSLKVYIPEHAPVRAKFTVISIPNGANTYSFLKNEGWINRAEVNGECIFALEPGSNGWGSQTEENDYVVNAMKFLTSGQNDNKVSVFSNYGSFYLVGYNTGCAPLESWSANNPIFVNSQVYINGTSVGQEYLDTVGSIQYNGKNTGGYDPGQDDEDFIETLKSLGYDGTFITKSEVPVPTWFIGYDDDSYSITYWKKANDVVGTPDGDVYHQDINSDAWQTQYADESILRNNPNAKYGMSQVKVSEPTNLKANDIFEFHSNYIRYTTTFAYSNHLEYRLDYGKMLVDLQKKVSSANVISKVYNMPDGETGSYDFYAQADTKVEAYDGKTGTVISGIVALTDYNNDGKKDPRDYIAYVPDSAKEMWSEQGAPVVLVHPGMTQTASVFMDASMWWQVANDEGCAVIIVGEAYSSATGVSYKSDNAEFAYMLEDILSSKINDYAKLDFSRIYGSGHSLGCKTIQDLSMSNPDLIAAVSSTSFPPSTTVRTGEMMPNYFIHGQSDLPFELPDLWGNTGLQSWATYFFEANGLKTDINSYNSSNTSGRFHTYVWNNSQGIPLVKYGYTVAREHNCIPQEFTMGWDFLKHYSFEKDANGHVTARYYSPSGFINDDAVVIIRDEPNLTEVTKAEFVAKISDYFAWPHPTEYNDIWKAPLKQFNDVKTSDKYGKQIEVAYEENIISPDEFGNFNPENKISRQDAAVIFAKAFKIADSNKMVDFEDIASISSETIKSVNALVELGFMSGKTDTLFAPNDYITVAEVNSIFDKITTTTVAPVQALPKQSIEYTAPRRYIKLYDPTPGATIYFTKTVATDLASIVEPAMPDITNPDQIYTVADDGHIKEDYTKNVDTYVQYKAVAVKDGMAISPVQTFTWHLYRPASADFEAVLIQEKTATSPAIYEIYNDAESVRAMAWYIEGEDSGIVFDALQTSINVRDMNAFVSENVATKPYSLIIGHTHPDHDAQLMNFLNAGIDVYVNQRGWSEIYKNIVTDPIDQSKIKNIEEGDVIDLGGGVKLDVFAMPGHNNSNIVLQDKANGLVFASDIYGCTRAGSADNVSVSGLRADLLLSFAQQTYSNYQKDGGKTNSLFTGHDEYALNDSNIKLFEAALQQVIDKGESGCSPTLRGGNNKPYSRTTLIGDMWKDGTNWISLLLVGIMGDDTEYLSSTTDISNLPYMADNSINYNGTDGFMKYSVLSNIEIEGGELVGKTVEWAPSKTFSWAGEEITVDTALKNRFNPWSYDYTINVPASNESITIIPTTMSTKVKSIKLNGNEIGYRSNNNVPVSDGTVITISIVAPDNITTSTYSFTVRKETVTKAEFVAKISDYFAWPHPTEYNDIWKAPLKTFNDVKTSDTYGKQIEVAYEQNIISPDAYGNFNPESKITRQDAAVIFAKAFKIADSNKTVEFSDRTSISEDAIGSVNALVELGYMSGKTATLFAPSDPITNTEVNSIFNKITTTSVAPVQALPNQTVEPYTAPRRFVKLYTPTDGAKIYYTKASSTAGWPNVEDPTTSSDEYVLAVNGHISELVGLRSGELEAPDNYVVYKAIAVKDGKISPVQTFKWHLYRPMDGEFQYEQLKEKTATSPAVYEIFRNNESVRAMAWYIEGKDSGIIYDALQTPENVKNLKTFIDENIATKPYIAILGHEHGDHDAQIPNFIKGDIDVYANQRGWAAIGSPGGFGAVVTTPELQAKVKNVEEGMTFDLGGGTIFEVYALPGHANGNVALYDRQSGYLFSSDFYGCTRAGSADTVGISGVRADLLLSFVQQVYSNYTKNGSEVTALFTGHDESQLSDNNLKLFEAALQQVIDNGEAGCTPSVRGSNNRTTMIGDMYKDGTNWIALELGGKMGDDKEYLSSTTDLSVVPYMSDPENDGLNYNAGGYTKYSVLSNIEIEGGELEGKTVQWAKDGNEFQWNGETITVNPSLENRFNPWSYDYTINVPESSESITIIPTTMSTKVKSIKLNGKEIEYRSSNNVPVSDGTVITISIIAPDNITTSTYSFTVKKGTLNAVNLDDVEAPTVDFTKANKLPITGYFEKNFDIDGLARTAKVYIPEGTPVRAYFTVIAVPNNVDTEEFLVESGWKTLADERAEGLFVLEASSEGWGNFNEEQSYITKAIDFFSSNNNRFSIFGEHYFVGYGSGAPILEAWAVANPLKVISQVYVNSEALTEDYLNQFATKEFGGTNGNYGVIEFPDGFEKIKYNEVVLPTWYINPDSAYSVSLDYWKNANDCADSSTDDSTFGTIYRQSKESDRWMTSHSGPISEVAVLNDTEFDIMNSDDTNDIYDFLSYYTRYENAVAYGNQLSVRANYDELGIEIKTMTVLGELREYMIYVPESARENWGDAAPAVVVLPGNSQTDKVFLDATQWWQVAEDEGFILAIVCEQNNVSAPTTVSHKNTNEFYKQLKEVIVNEYNADPARIYVTGQSAGSMGSQSLAIAMPEYFAAIASTSGASSPSATGTINIDGISYDASNKMIPNYHIYGAGDLAFLIGDLWDSTDNSLDSWAIYHLGVNDFELGDSSNYTSSGWMNRFKTWTWSKEIEGIDVPFVKLTQNIYRSHNCISEEMPMLWDFLKHYSYELDENGNVIRYYSPSGFENDDAIQIFKDEPSLPESEITSYTAITAVNIELNEHLVDLTALIASGKLPNTVEVTDGTSTTHAAITGWIGDFDGEETGAYTLTAIWTIPEDYIDDKNPISVTLTVNVNVIQGL